MTDRTEMCARCGKVGPDTPWGPSYDLCPDGGVGNNPDCFIYQAVEEMFGRCDGEKQQGEDK